MELKVMTFNIRIPLPNDGVNSFTNRQPLIKALIDGEAPDIIGIQEATDDIKKWLRSAIGSEYDVIGCGRDADRFGESCPIAYKKDLFELVSFETFALSPTPHIPGSKFPEPLQSKFPRMASHACLVHRELDRPIHFFNTHFDFKTDEVATLGMTVMLERLSACDGTLFLTGDMNSIPHKLAMRLPLEMSACPLVDATAHIVHTSHDFGNNTENKKIDYIFTNAKVLECYPRDDEPVDGTWISDHFPVVAVLEM